MSPRRAAGANSAEGLERAHRRLGHLYEISTLFATFENVEHTFDPALGIAARTLPLHSAILIETEDSLSRMIVWTSDGQSAETMRAVEEHVEAAYAGLVGAVATASLDRREHASMTTRSPHAETDPAAGRLIVIPLVVANRPPFGALQVEGTRPLDETDLMFVGAIANQLAIAIDRARAWRNEITRRVDAEAGQTHAEKGRADAEARRARADRDRISAESSSERYAALAGENARLFEEAQQAVRAREQLLAIVSHDLRNPLGTIVMVVDALERSGAVPQAVGRIQRAARRMQRLVEDLLDFASIEAGKFAIRRQPQDPDSMIQETLASFEGVAQAKGLQLKVNDDSHSPLVYCDRDRILQVLGNLVGNATKATPEGGHITLRVEARGHEVLFAVSDDGPGISEEDVKHLFERYWRSEDAVYKGTGLGLAIASGIVSAHGGRIWVESVLGRGSSFHFTIPVADMTLLFAVPAPEAAAADKE